MRANIKMIQIWRNVFVIIAMIACLIGCARKDPLFNPPPATSPELSMNEMEAGIFEGCTKRGWSPSKIKEGEIEATLYLREHIAVVRIFYLPGRFTIKYVSSEKLDYGKDKNGVEVIHPHYNSWVQYLKNDISVALAQHAREKEVIKPTKPNKRNRY